MSIYLSIYLSYLSIYLSVYLSWHYTDVFVVAAAVVVSRLVVVVVMVITILKVFRFASVGSAGRPMRYLLHGTQSHSKAKWNCGKEIKNQPKCNHHIQKDRGSVANK